MDKGTDLQKSQYSTTNTGLFVCLNVLKINIIISTLAKLSTLPKKNKLMKVQLQSYQLEDNE